MDWLNILKNMCIAAVAIISTFFDSTFGYLCALTIGFAINIIAGFRADEVKITLHRVFPPKWVLKNFCGNKLKDSLMELFLIVSLTYLLKLLIDLMDYQSHSKVVVQFMIALAIYWYFRNALRNLNKAYPKVFFIRVMNAVIGFKFKELIGADLANIVKEEEGRK